jgi:hypothetical protein
MQMLSVSEKKQSQVQSLIPPPPCFSVGNHTQVADWAPQDPWTAAVPSASPTTFIRPRSGKTNAQL